MNMSTVISTPLAHAVLRPLPGATRSRAISARICDAIVLGVFGAGEQIPSEAELAGVFDVAPMTVRDALTTLRTDGLIVTRRGRGGGSFVTDSATERLLADPHFPMASQQDTRDITDHLTALTTGAAALAAQRASPAEQTALGTAISDARSATSAVERAQACARVAMQLATAAQAPHLTREVMKAQTAWIPRAAHALATDSVAADAATVALESLPAALRDRSSDTARRSVEDHIRYLSDALTEHRVLDLQRSRPDEPSTSDKAIDTLDQLLERSLDALRLVALAPDLEQACSTCLAEYPELAGVGFAGNPDTGHNRVDWYTRPSASAPVDPSSATTDTAHRRPVDTTPNALGFTGYRQMDWYATPEASKETTVTGPYVDFLCGDSYTFTLSVPAGKATDDDVFSGVYVADLAVSTVEQVLQPLLASAEGQPLVISPIGRVTASTHPQWPVGSLVNIDECKVRSESAEFGFRVVDVM